MDTYGTLIIRAWVITLQRSGAIMTRCVVVSRIGCTRGEVDNYVREFRKKAEDKIGDYEFSWQVEAEIIIASQL